jgi:cysteine synthase A
MMTTLSSNTTIAPSRLITGAATCHNPAIAVGSTPVQWIDRPFAPPRRGFWAKLEGFNPGGMKDRPALHMIAEAKERGELRPGAMIVESTSGTLGLGLALAGIVHGHSDVGDRPGTGADDPPHAGRARRASRAGGGTASRWRVATGQA